MNFKQSSPALDLEVWASTKASVVAVLRRAAEILGKHEDGIHAGCCYAITSAGRELHHEGVVINQADRVFLSAFEWDNELSERGSVYFFGPTWMDHQFVLTEAEIEAAYQHRVIALLFLAEMLQDEPTDL